MIKRVKSIKEIFEEVKAFDLVITNDAPLATALNKLVDKPRLGYLAMTPKQIASQFAELYFENVNDKFEVVLDICRKSKKPLKYIHSIVEKIYEVWMYNAKLEFTEQFLSEDEASLIKYIKEINTIETAMENFNEDFYGNKNIAVAGEELFTLLDLEVLPRRGKPAVKTGLFKDSEYSIDRTFVFSNINLLIDNIIKLITKENAGQTAIVLNPDSEYLELIKVRLKESGINIEIKNYLSEDLYLRNLISFAEFSFRADDLTVKEFSNISNEFGLNIENKYFNYDLNIFFTRINKDKKLSILFDFFKKTGDFTYSEMINKLEKDYHFKIPSEFKEVLELLEFSGNNITENNLTEIKYFLKEIDVETDTVQSGVLFVNALNSAFIDRQIIIYTGLDNSWMRIFPDKDYLNKEEEEKKNLERFQILMQQGKYRYYFVQNISEFKVVAPCYYFLLLSGADTRSFMNDYFNPVLIENTESLPEFKSRSIKLPDEKLKEVTSISPSSLNNFFTCPKFFSLKNLLPSEEVLVMKKGTLMHCFAELYFNHPEFTRDNLAKITGIMTKNISMFQNELNEQYEKTIFEIASEVVMNFIDNQNISKSKLPKPVAAEDNILMEALNKEKIYSNTEKWLSGNDKTLIRGKIDLQYGDTIVDYKTSAKRKSESEVTLQSNLDFIYGTESDNIDFQAIAYITALKSQHTGINFIYNFLLSNLKYQIDKDLKIEKNQTLIKYIPVTFTEYIYSKEVFDQISDTEKKHKLLLDKIGYENYKYILDNLNLDTFDYFVKDKLRNKFLEVTVNVLDDLGIKYSDFKSKMQRTFNVDFIIPVADNIFNIRTGKTEYGLIFRDDTDKFSEMLKEKIKEINRYNESVYPFTPIYGSRDICRQCDYLNLCIGNKLWN